MSSYFLRTKIENMFHYIFIYIIYSFFQAIVTCIFFTCKYWYCNDIDNGSDSGISESWASTSTEYDEDTPLILSTIDSGYRMYTEDKIQYYEHTRKQESEVKFFQFSKMYFKLAKQQISSCRF